MQLHNLVEYCIDLQYQCQNLLEQMVVMVVDKLVADRRRNLENQTYLGRCIQGIGFDTCSTVVEQRWQRQQHLHLRLVDQPQPVDRPTAVEHVEGSGFERTVVVVEQSTVAVAAVVVGSKRLAVAAVAYWRQHQQLVVVVALP